MTTMDQIAERLDLQAKGKNLDGRSVASVIKIAPCFQTSLWYARFKAGTSGASDWTFTQRQAGYSLSPMARSHPKNSWIRNSTVAGLLIFFSRHRIPGLSRLY